MSTHDDSIDRWKRIPLSRIPIPKDPVPDKTRSWKFLASGTVIPSNTIETTVYVDDFELYTLEEHEDGRLEIIFVDSPTEDCWRRVPFDEFLWSLEEAKRKLREPWPF